MPKSSIIFFGTHHFATAILESLVNSEYKVSGIITQPDRPAGRSKKIQKPQTKIYGEAHNIPVFQPETLKNYSIQVEDAILAVCAQYGSIIPQSVLDIFPKGIINVHTSLLPKYRGASPIQSAIRNGDTETGVTIMKMDKGMDTGDILSQASIAILPDETYPELESRMAVLGGTLLTTTLPLYLNESIVPEKQNSEHATQCKIISRDDGKIDWENMTAEEIYNMYRAYTPWPGIWTFLEGKRLKLLQIKKTEHSLPAGMCTVTDKQIFVGTKNGSVEIIALQEEGGKPLTAEIFLRGHAEKIKNAHLG